MRPTQTPRLHALLQWGRHHGGVAAIKRLRVMVLPLTVKERIILDRVVRETECSPEYYEAVRQALETITDREYQA